MPTRRLSVESVKLQRSLSGLTVTSPVISPKNRDAGDGSVRSSRGEQTDKLVEAARHASALHFDIDSGRPIAGLAGWVDPSNNPRSPASHPLNLQRLAIAAGNSDREIALPSASGNLRHYDRRRNVVGLLGIGFDGSGLPVATGDHWIRP